ncbi:MAG: hypothetical protein RLZZ324_930 [Candidatus Parcubacteria bacterium]|jgi:mannose-6-phosphate isomerase-like protein (cupin superfamily)
MKGTLITALVALAFVGAGCVTTPGAAVSGTPNTNVAAAVSAGGTNTVLPMSYHGDIIKDAKENTYFRRVVFTGKNSQLVVMSIPPGGEVGEETHKHTEQTLFFLSGTGEARLNDETYPIAPGNVTVVTPGTKHNFINTGSVPLQIYTVYAPPNHIDGRIHKTKADADADVADEAVGE